MHEKVFKLLYLKLYLYEEKTMKMNSLLLIKPIMELLLAISMGVENLSFNWLVLRFLSKINIIIQYNLKYFILIAL
jgi:hypothetical protein